MATTDERLVGRIAEILNAREVVITLGRERGVKPGMKFAILTDPLEIKDPESGEVLDVLEREKTRVVVRAVRDRIAICRTYARGGGASMDPKEISDAHGVDTLADPYSIDSGSLGAASYAEEYVKVGDRAIPVFDDERV